MASTARAVLLFALSAGSFYAIAFVWNAERASWPLVDAQVVEADIAVTREAQGVENRGVLRLRVQYQGDDDGSRTAQLDIPGHLKALRALAKEDYAPGTRTRVRINPDNADHAIRANVGSGARWAIATLVGLVFFLSGVSALTRRRDSEAPPPTRP